MNESKDVEQTDNTPATDCIVKEKWERPEFKSLDINKTQGGPAPASYDDTFVHS